MNLISVIIPAYNVEQYLARCLDSVLNQTYQKLEVIVIDDGSTDGTGAIADAYAEKDPRVRVVNQKNSGSSCARERGIAIAAGSYVAFVDSDDEIEPDMLERLLNNALNYHADISQCGILYCFYDGRRKPKYGTGKLTVLERDDGLRELIRGNTMEPSLCNKLYAARILKDSCPDTSIAFNEDLLHNVVLFSRSERSVHEDFCGYRYWRRTGSKSNDPQRAVCIAEDILKARKLIQGLVPETVSAEADSSYFHALIMGFTACIGLRTKEAAALRRRCRQELRELLPGAKDTPGLRNRAMAIVYLPFLYSIAIKVHVWLRTIRIRLQAAKHKEEA